MAASSWVRAGARVVRNLVLVLLALVVVAAGVLLMVPQWRAAVLPSGTVTLAGGQLGVPPGDGDEFCRTREEGIHDIRVEVAAIPEGNAARDVILKASGFIDLREYLEQGQGIEHDDAESALWGDEVELASPDIPAESDEDLAADHPELMTRPVRGATGYPRPPAARN